MPKQPPLSLPNKPVQSSDVAAFMATASLTQAEDGDSPMTEQRILLAGIGTYLLKPAQVKPPYPYKVRCEYADECMGYSVHVVYHVGRFLSSVTGRV